MSRYSEQAARLREPISEPSMNELIRYATLAANSHNTQPWRFEIVEQGARIVPDFSRRTPVVDPDDHHLWTSLGCAAENLIIAARAQGHRASIQFDSHSNGAILIVLEPGPIQAGDLYNAIPLRQSTRTQYRGLAVAAGDLAQLKQSVAMDGVSVQWMTEASQLESIAEFVVRANNMQFNDGAFIRELKHWLRFNPVEAIANADGLFSGCTGNPSIPGWLGRAAFSVLLRKKTVSDQYAAQIQSSSGVAVFIGDQADPAHWVKVGRSFQRFALKSTALGIRHAHINQPIEVNAMRKEFAEWLGVPDKRPDLVIRFGYADALPMSIRRPVKDVIASAE